MPMNPRLLRPVAGSSGPAIPQLTISSVYVWNAEEMSYWIAANYPQEGEYTVKVYSDGIMIYSELQTFPIPEAAFTVMGVGGTSVQISLANAVGEGPLSNAFIAPVPRTLYYTAEVNNDWATLGNWFNDPGSSEPAASLPTNIDSVSIEGSVYGNSGPPPVVLWLTVAGVSLYLPDGITVINGATFNYGASNASEAAPSVVTCNVMTYFLNNSANFGFVDGPTVFDSASINYGTINGGVEFMGGSGHASGGIVQGDAYFFDSGMAGDVAGTAYFYGSAYYTSGTAGSFVPDPPPII